MDEHQLRHPFDEAVRQIHSEIRLAHAALLLAEDAYDNVSPPAYLARLDAMAKRADEGSPRTASDRVSALRQVLVDGEGLQGNLDDYHNPDNLYLNRVLDTRRGVPITLGTIWIDVADALGWPIVGMDMPGHFLLRYDGDDEELLIDPFNNGHEVSRAFCAEMTTRLFGPEFQLTEAHFAAISPRGLLGRILGNIYAFNVQREDWPQAVWALRRLNAVSADDAVLLAELGRLETKLGDLDSASRSLKHALKLAQGTEHVATINHHLFEVRRLINERN
ncbi:MAG: hypothetical protein HOP29_09770 [Phycisphaerales bacterium]|nr:hypothetical protein [Phycisphaerales bacterium]